MNIVFKVLIFSAIALVSCESQSQTKPVPPSAELFPFRPQKYKDVSQEVKDRLYIPFLEKDKYGIANYEGELLLKPQFDYIKMIDLAFPYFWAGTYKNATLYDLKGNQVRDVDNQPIYKNEVSFVRYEKAEGAKGFEAPLLVKIKHKVKGYLPAEASLEDRKAISSNAQVEEFDPGRPSNRYYYINAHTNGNPKAYFNPSYNHLPTSNTGRTWFSFDYSLDSLTKVMTESGKFTFLDLNGNPIVEPNWNCVPLAPNKMKLFNKNGLCALKDLKTGWQTDFAFKEIHWTKHPEIFTAEVWRPKTNDPKDGRNKIHFVIRNGKVKELPIGEEWHVVDKDFSIIQKTIGEPTYQTTYSLWDNHKWKEIRGIPSKRFYTLFDKKGIDLNGKSKPKAFLSLEGDTIALPTYPSFKSLNDTIAYFKDAEGEGLFNDKLEEVFRIDSGTMRITWDSFFIIKKNEKMGLINLSGDEIVPMKYTRVDAYPLCDWIFVSEGKKHSKEVKYGLLDINGKPVFPLIYNQLYPSGFTHGDGTGLEIKYGKTHYILNKDYEIVVEQNKDKPLLTKDLYKVSDLDSAVQADYDAASLPKLYTQTAVLQGRDYLHIFHSDGTYVTSIKGRASQPEKTVYTGSRHGRDMGQVRTGIIKVRMKNGVEYFVRLGDGYAYRN